MKKIIKTMKHGFTTTMKLVKQSYKKMSVLWKSNTQLMIDANKELSKEDYKSEKSKYTIIV